VSLQVNYHMGFQHSLLFCRFWQILQGQ
jgi:hypothetical protein